MEVAGLEVVGGEAAALGHGGLFVPGVDGGVAAGAGGVRVGEGWGGGAIRCLDGVGLWDETEGEDDGGGEEGEQRGGSPHGAGVGAGIGGRRRGGVRGRPR